MDKYHNLTVKEALQQFYEDYHLEKDGGIEDKAAKVELFNGISIYIPNVEARKKVLQKHDMHHVLTGYPANMQGEFQISAWEISTNCRHNWVALFLNYFGMIGGFPLSPSKVFKAYLRGKVSRNLYHSKYTAEQILQMKVGELREELGLTAHPRISAGVKLKALMMFIGNSLLGIPASVISISAIPFILLYTFYIYTSNKWQIA